MTEKEVYELINYVVSECVKLKNKYVDEQNLKIDYVCIFSQNQNEYDELFEIALTLGKIVDETPTGSVFAFNYPSETIAGYPKVLKIRKPDETRPQRGDVDFITDYRNFKKQYLNSNKFTLIKRENFEMIELKDDYFNVLAYFSNIPPSKQLEDKVGI